MKKLSLLLGGVILSATVMAQKPTEGAPMSLEGQIGLQSQAGATNGNILQFTAPSIRFRYFVLNNLAIRATVGIENRKTTDTYYEVADFSGATGTVIDRSNGWNGAIGAEYHFAGTNRLSPYAGLDIRFGGGNSSQTGDNVMVVPGPPVGFAYSSGDKFETESKYGRFGVGLVAGTDFYFAENFYLGLELGLAWASTTSKQDTYSVTVGGTTTSGKSDGLSKTSTLSTNATGLFRLGWRF